jgi:DNA-binding NtrC family response regulator
MVDVCIVEEDADLRESLQTILDSAGYTTTALPDFAAAFAYLRARSAPVVVLAGNAQPHHCHIAAFFAQVVADDAVAARHRFVVLSTAPALIPPDMRAILDRLRVPVLPKPFDVDTLLDAVGRVPARAARGRRPSKSA